MSNYTLDQLASLKKAYARGVLKVREGDSWVEYQSMKDMRIAIGEMEAEIERAKANQVKPTGSRVVRFRGRR